MRAEDRFHVGIVVDDLDGGMAELADLFGYEWCDQIAIPTSVAIGDEPAAELALRFAYSKSAPRIEIIQSHPGTIWVPVPASGIHHLGYWSDDVVADAGALEGRGYRREVRGLGPDGAPHWTFHVSPTGLRVELVTRMFQPAFEHYWATGSMPTG